MCLRLSDRLRPDGRTKSPSELGRTDEQHRIQPHLVLYSGRCQRWETVGPSEPENGKNNSQNVNSCITLVSTSYNDRHINGVLYKFV